MRGRSVAPVFPFIFSSVGAAINAGPVAMSTAPCALVGILRRSIGPPPECSILPSRMTAEVNAVLEEARADPNVIGAYLMGSHAIGNADSESDWDLVVVMRAGGESQRKTPT